MSPFLQNNMNELVILVDKKDNQTGTETKLKAHEDGLLHRAFSVLVFNAKGELLLQQRAAGKYHSARLWTNTCCSHPRPGESPEKAAHRRLMEEMGFDCEMRRVDTLHYETPVLESGLKENELLHLFIGNTDLDYFNPNAQEVKSWRWISPDELKKEVEQKPEEFSYWLRVYLDRYDLKDLFSKTLSLSAK